MPVLKNELEDLSFKYVNPDEYQKLVDLLIENKESREKYIQSVIGPLQIKMALEDFDCTIQGRTKNIYSIYNKIESTTTRRTGCCEQPITKIERTKIKDVKNDRFITKKSVLSRINHIFTRQSYIFSAKY